MNELDRLRADLEVLERLWNSVHFAGCAMDFDSIKSVVRKKIAKLEAEAADPWADAKRIVSHWQDCPESNYGHTQVVVEYVRHLEAELESAKNCEIDENGHFVRDLSDAETYADENGHIVFPDDKAEAGLWADARRCLKLWSKTNVPLLNWQESFISLVRHLEAENARQAARIAELEAEQGTFPALEPKRVIATACKVIASMDDKFLADCLMQRFKAGDAGIYPLAGDELT
jgi:hypothetical protein